MITLDDIRAAHTRIAPYVRRTPVLTSEDLDQALGCKLFFKCENLQAAGAFKSRGAVNAVLSLTPEQAARGVATHSSGNHAAALSRAARLRGVPAYIVMPENSARSKIRNVERQGGKITFCAPSPEAREAACEKVIAETGAVLVHPYQDERVMAGQGTAAIELLDDVPNLDTLLCPVGGGGLLSGAAVAVKAIRPSIRVIGTEPLQADDAARSFRAKQLVPTTANTIADGLRTVVGRPNLDVMLRYVDDVLTATEAGIVSAMRELWEGLHVLVEPSSAVPYAAMKEHREQVPGRSIGIILTGGNVDLDRLPWQT